MKLDKIDRDLDNPKFKESRVFKKGGYLSTKKTVNFVPGRKNKSKRVVVGTY